MIKTLFRIISYLEGISYLLLLFLGTPMKYFAENDKVVKALGMPHGILFLAYILLALIIRKSQNWDMRTFLMVLVASVLPFGTFYVDRKLVK